MIWSINGDTNARLPIGKPQQEYIQVKRETERDRETAGNISNEFFVLLISLSCLYVVKDSLIEELNLYVQYMCVYLKDYLISMVNMEKPVGMYQIWKGPNRNMDEEVECWPEDNGKIQNEIAKRTSPQRIQNNFPNQAQAYNKTSKTNLYDYD